MRKQVDRILSKYSPAALVVDENLEVLEIRGKTSPYLTLPVGKMSCNLVKLIPDTGLFLQVEELIRQAKESGEPARHERVPSEYSGSAGSLNLEVVPLDFNPTRSTLVAFRTRRRDHRGARTRRRIRFPKATSWTDISLN